MKRVWTRGSPERQRRMHMCGVALRFEKRAGLVQKMCGLVIRGKSMQKTPTANPFELEPIVLPLTQRNANARLCSQRDGHAYLLI